jgi:cytochrome c-type biogenesis protein CcmH/NrfG
VKELERALTLLEPDDPIITWHLADAYRSVSRFQEALTTYRRALELRPEQDDAVRIQEQIDLLELQLKGASSGKVP